MNDPDHSKCGYVTEEEIDKEIELGKDQQKERQHDMWLLAGFTVLELIITVGIISVLTGIGLPNFFSSLNNSKHAADLATIRNWEAYLKSDYDNWPEPGTYIINKDGTLSGNGDTTNAITGKCRDCEGKYLCADVTENGITVGFVSFYASAGNDTNTPTNDPNAITPGQQGETLPDVTSTTITNQETGDEVNVTVVTPVPDEYLDAGYTFLYVDADGNYYDADGNPAEI